MKTLIFIFSILISINVFAKTQNLNNPKKLLKELTIKQKIAQVIQPEVGFITPEEVLQYGIGTVLKGGGTLNGETDATSLSNNGPYHWAKLVESYKAAALKSEVGIPLLFAVDAVHGHNNVTGATLFPHNIGLGATRDSKLLYEIGRATAIEVMATGIDWNFAPTVAVAKNERWGRTYESFSEKTDLVTKLGSAYIKGIQSPLKDGYAIIGTAKHWIGDGGTSSGKDQGDTQISLEELKGIHMPPYIEAIRLGIKTVMVSFNSFNGKKLHEHKYLVTKLLKKDLGFKGVVVSDWNGIDQIQVPSEFTSEDEIYMYQIAKAFDAGIDVFMVPEKWKKFITLAEVLVKNYAENKSPSIDPKRLDQAVLRVLELKHSSRIATKPIPSILYNTYRNNFASKKHRELAKKAARESAVLLKNNLPDMIELGDSVLVLGEHAKNTGFQAGGWSLAWQGVKTRIPGSLSVYNGLQEEASRYFLDLKYSSTGKNINVEDVDKIVVVLGEEPYAEGEGDRDKNGPQLSLKQTDLLKRALSFNKPVIVVLVSGRPMILPDEIKKVNSLIAYWLPGTMGNGIAELLVGKYRFSGRLSFSWPADPSQINGDYRNKDFNWRYRFGFGLSN